ncbi:hypothetical protein R1sor_005532 [Riccia sorocarpa]|uniref:DDE Tnp4 domain-containing protein n=1 Tax=Riccia sorocarpa TaxID=122646 RepID=A0ABD3HM46_9MARC
MVNYTNRVMTALESAMGHEIAWPDRQERAVNSAHFVGLGFSGCIGRVDCTLVKLSLRPRDDGETYFDRKSNYSMNVQVICDQNKHVIYFFADPGSSCFSSVLMRFRFLFFFFLCAGMPGSCHDLTCLRRSSLWGRLGSAQLFDNGQYLLGDSGYIPLDRLVCSYKRTGGDMDKVDFNTRIAHARVGNEHCIGILKARWHSLKEIRTQLRNLAENVYVIRWMRCYIILHNFLIWRRDEWSKDDHPIEVESEDDLGPPPQGARECSRRGLERRQAVQHGGALTFRGGGRELHQVEVEAHRVLRGIDGILLKRSGLHDALWMDWARLDEGTTSVKEFILNWDDRTQSSTAGGREIPLTIDTMRETAKTWYANDIFMPVWRPIIQLINVVLLGKQKPVEVTWAFLYILKNKVGHADEDENLDWATYFKEKIREEIQERSARSRCKPLERGNSGPHALALWCCISSGHADLTSSSPERRQVSPDPRDIPSSSSPGCHQDSPDRQHSPESSPGEGGGGGGAPSTLSDHTTRSGSPTSPDREEPSDNEPLAGFGSPMVPYPPDDDDEEGTIACLTSLGASDPQRYRRISGPCCTKALLNPKRSDLRDQTA